MRGRVVVRNLSFHLNQTSSLWPSVGVRCRPLFSPPPNTIHKALMNITAFISCLIALIFKILNYLSHILILSTEEALKIPFSGWKLTIISTDGQYSYILILRKKFCLLSISFWREGNGITFSGILIICLCPTVWAELNQSIHTHTQPGEVEIKNQGWESKHRKNCECCPGHHLSVQIRKFISGILQCRLY